MNTGKNRKTTSKLNELVADVLNLPDHPVGEHLSGKEFHDYAMETLAEDAVHRVEQHLDSCHECATHMEEVLEEPEARSGELRRRRFAELRRELEEFFTRATQDWQEHLPVIPQLAASPGGREVWSYKSSDKSFEASAYLEENRDCTFDFRLVQPLSEVDEVELGTMRLSLPSGPLDLPIKWYRVPRMNQYVARIRLPRDQESKLANIEFKVG